MPDFVKNGKNGKEVSYKVWWCMELYFGAQNLVTSANSKFRLWYQFGHENMKFGGQSLKVAKMAKNAKK